MSPDQLSFLYGLAGIVVAFLLSFVVLKNI